MIRQRMVKFGASLLLTVGFGAGVALADTPTAQTTAAPSGTPKTEAQSSDTSLGSSGSASVMVDHHSEQAVGDSLSNSGSSSNNSPGDSANSLSKPTIEPSKVTQGPTEKVTPKLTDTGVNPVVKDTTIAPPQSNNIHSAPANSAEAIHTATYGTNSPLQQAGPAQLAHKIASNTQETAPVPLAPASQHPNMPTEPLGGLLQGILTVTSDIFVPVLVGLPNTVQLLYSTVPVLTILLIGLALFALSLNRRPVHWYTARLRLSGYLGAPRSHVTASTLFATPLKWVLSASSVPT